MFKHAHPELQRLKVKIAIFLTIMMMGRLVCLLVDTIFHVTRDFDLATLILTCVVFGGSVLLALLIVNGAKVLIYLLMIPAIYSSLSLLSYEGGVLIEKLRLGDTFYNFYFFTIIIADVLQVVLCVYMAVSKRLNQYFSEVLYIMGDMIEKIKNEQNVETAHEAK